MLRENYIDFIPNLKDLGSIADALSFTDINRSYDYKIMENSYKEENLLLNLTALTTFNRSCKNLKINSLKSIRKAEHFNFVSWKVAQEKKSLSLSNFWAQMKEFPGLKKITHDSYKRELTEQLVEVLRNKESYLKKYRYRLKDRYQPSINYSKAVSEEDFNINEEKEVEELKKNNINKFTLKGLNPQKQIINQLDSKLMRIIFLI